MNGSPSTTCPPTIQRTSVARATAATALPYAAIGFRRTRSAHSTRGWSSKAVEKGTTATPFTGGSATGLSATDAWRRAAAGDGMRLCLFQARLKANLLVMYQTYAATSTAAPRAAHVPARQPIGERGMHPRENVYTRKSGISFKHAGRVNGQIICDLNNNVGFWMACLGRSRQLRRPRSDMPTGAVERSGRAVDSTDAQGQQCVIAQSLGIALARLRDLDAPPRDDLLDDIGLPHVVQRPTGALERLAHRLGQVEIECDILEKRQDGSHSSAPFGPGREHDSSLGYPRLLGAAAPGSRAFHHSSG